jgi:hypothetical protein
LREKLDKEGNKELSNVGTDATMKSVKVPTVNGKKEAFQTWWMRFKALANAYGFLPALSAKAEKDLPTTEDNEAEINVDQQAAVKRNNMAVYYLTLALTTDEALEFYHKGISEEHPSGLAWLIVKALHPLQIAIVIFLVPGVCTRQFVYPNYHKLSKVNTIEPMQGCHSNYFCTARCGCDSSMALSDPIPQSTRLF